jgi:hypothetical protein
MYTKKLSSGLLQRVVFTDFSDVLAANTSERRSASIIRAMIMEAANISETSGNFYHITRPNNPEDSHLHNLCCEHLKSQRQGFFYMP